MEVLLCDCSELLTAFHGRYWEGKELLKRWQRVIRQCVFLAKRSGPELEMLSVRRKCEGCCQLNRGRCESTIGGWADGQRV